MTPSDYETRETTRRDETQCNVATRCEKFPLFFKPMEKYTYLTVSCNPSAHNIENDGMSRHESVDRALERHGRMLPAVLKLLDNGRIVFKGALLSMWGGCGNLDHMGIQ